MFSVFYATLTTSFLSLYRDKHGRPVSHPDYDPRTLLVRCCSRSYWGSPPCPLPGKIVCILILKTGTWKFAVYYKKKPIKMTFTKMSMCNSASHVTSICLNSKIRVPNWWGWAVKQLQKNFTWSALNGRTNYMYIVWMVKCNKLAGEWGVSEDFTACIYWAVWIPISKTPYDLIFFVV